MTVALIEELDDRTLVEQHRAGDEHAFRRIVERHHRSLYANALRRLGDPVLAEDALQETFLRAFRGLDRFDGDFHLDAWLHRIVTNACHDIGRRRGRDSRLFDRACTTVEVDAPAADEGLDDLPDRELDLALDQLPASYREVLLLRFVDEMSYSDVAEKAGISEQNARARVSRGRNMLKRMMSSASALVVWAIPPLRRTQVDVVDPDTAAQAAQQVHNLTGLTNAVSSVAPSGGLTHLGGLVAQAGPAIATATPAVTSTGPALKAAVAAGLAAAVVIPTGVAVDRAFVRPTPTTVPADQQGVTSDAGATVDELPAPTSTIPTIAGTPVGPLGADDAIVVAPTTSTTIAASPSTSTPPTTQAPPTTAVPPKSGGGTAPTAPAPTSPTSPTTQPAPPTVPAGKLTASKLSVENGGDRLTLAGPLTLTIDGDAHTGRLDGKILIGPPKKDPGAQREVERSTFTFTFDDGRVLELAFSGTAVVTDQGARRHHELTLAYDLRGGAAFGLAESGADLHGALDTQGSTGSLSLDLPGQQR